MRFMQSTFTRGGGGTGRVTPPKRYTRVESSDLRDMDDEVIFFEIFNFDVVNATMYISLDTCYIYLTLEFIEILICSKFYPILCLSLLKEVWDTFPILNILHISSF